MNTDTRAPLFHRTGVTAPESGDRQILRHPHALPTQTFTAVARGMIVLAVDEVQTELQGLGGILAAHHFEVHPATNGEDALAHVVVRRPDLILLDGMTPVMDGIEVCRRLKADPATADIPVVFLTAARESGLAVKALSAGAVDCIFQPFDIAELLARVHAHVALKRMRDELQRIIQMKNDVMDALVHDLKNPIGSMRFSALLLRESGIRGTDPRSELVDSIIESSDLALEFIDERLAEGACAQRIDHLALTRVDLIEVAHAAAHQNIRPAARKGIELVLDFPELPMAFVHADPRALGRVLNNLLSNAIKFSPPGLPVHVTIARDPTHHRMRVGVCDNGPGLTAEDRRHLFTPFRRLSARPTGGESSTGLGLSIAYDLMQKMDGQIGCDSRPGHGACFWIKLALAERSSAPEFHAVGPRHAPARASAPSAA